MVKKLFKHEFLALARVLLPTYGILLAIAGFTRILQIVEFDHIIYDIAIRSAVIFFGMACFVCLLMTMVMGLVRYYRNLFTAEGYLSFTLPVSPTQHLWVKLLTVVLFYVIAVVTIVLAGILALEGDLLIELIHAGDYLIKLVVSGPIGWQFWLYVAELLLAMLAGSAAGMLIYYTCMTIGQLAKKNRILLSVGVYIIYYSVVQALTTVAMLVLPLLGEEFWNPIGQFITENPHASAHIALCGILLFELAFGAILFLVCRRILTRRLNLE